VARRRRGTPEAELRRRVERRAGGRCEYCHAPQDAAGYRFHVEHIRPKARAGGNGIRNRALACAWCNLAKGDRVTATDPVNGAEVPLFNPRADSWEDHFSWQDGCRVLVGLTPSGRAAVAALDMNNGLRRRARGYWFQAGLLP
jgi:hypothetical protein